MSAMRSQKAAQDSQNYENIDDSWGFIALQTQLAIFLAGSWNKQVNKQILHWPCKLVWSRWLDNILVHFCIFMDRDEVEVHKNA